jgi:anti-sigma B factor antagonist
MKVSVETIASAKSGVLMCKIDLKGTLDNNNIHEFDYIINALIEGGIKKMILDIDDLQYIDSTGIGAFIRITKRLRQMNGEVAITRYTSQILNILKPIKMENFIKFFPNVKEGISYLESL